MNYFNTLTKEQKKALAEALKTPESYFRHYKSGFKTPGTKRIKKIIQWAEKNTPENVPTFQELIAIKNKKEVA